MNFRDDIIELRGRFQSTVSQESPVDNKEFGLKLEIDQSVYNKIMYWINKAPGEISGLGMVELDETTNTLRVTDTILLKQKNTSVSTEIDGHSVGKAMFLMKDAPGALKWHWHSHVNMDVFWSGTDIATIKELGGNGWFVATVFNKRKEMKTAYCQNAPVRLIMDNLTTEVVQAIDEDTKKELDKQYDDNVEVQSVFSFGSDQSVIWEDEEDVLPYLSVPKDEEEEEENDPDQLVEQFSLLEMFQMKKKGICSEEMFEQAIDESSDEELKEFYDQTGFEVG